MVMAGDGVVVLHPAAEESVVTDWLLDNGFGFVADALLAWSAK
jgi:hypothetical protein